MTLTEYEAVFMFGLDKSLTDSVRIEAAAELNGKVLRTALDASAARKLFEAEEIVCAVSENPARYLCNAAYFHALKRFNGRALFFHIPPLRHMTDSMAESIVRAVNAAYPKCLRYDIVEKNNRKY